MQPLTLLSILLPISLTIAPTYAHSHTVSPTHLHRARSICSSSSTSATNLHCLLAHEATEGPFYIPHPLLRSNITEDRPGVPFTLNISIIDATTCTPASGVYVDIWHADASGSYSGWATEAEENVPITDSDALLSSSFAAPPEHGPPHGPPHGPGGPGPRPPKESSRWLRGVQQTDASGFVVFHTIWPGWYHPRTTHIHVRVHAGNASVANGVLLDAGREAHTGQFFFTDELVKRVARTRLPYSDREDSVPIMNGDDGIYVGSDGAEQVMEVTEEESGTFLGRVTVGIDPKADHHGDAGVPDHDGFPHMWGSVKMAALAGLMVTGTAFLIVMVARRWRRRQAGAIALP